MNRLKRRKIMKNFIAIFIAALLFVNGAIFAGPLDKSQVSKDAKWIAHLDNDQLGKSVTGGLIRQNLEQTGALAEMEDFAALCSFDPLIDINDITVYSREKDKGKFVVVFDGNFDKEALLSLVPEDMQHEVIKYGQFELHALQEEAQTNKRYMGIDLKYDGEIKLETRQGTVQDNDQVVSQAMYGCFFNDELIVMSPDLDVIKSAIDVLNGTAENARESDFIANSYDNESIFFQATVHNVGGVAGQGPKAAIFQQTETLELVIGESDGLFFVNIDLLTKSAEAAQTIDTMLDGILAFAVLLGEEKEGDEAKLSELASKVTILSIENSVQIRFESEPESVMELLNKEMEEELEKPSPPSK
jgi:hypothetical protein